MGQRAQPDLRRGRRKPRPVDQDARPFKTASRLEKLRGLIFERVARASQMLGRGGNARRRQTGIGKCGPGPANARAGKARIGVHRVFDPAFVAALEPGAQACARSLEKRSYDAKPFEWYTR